MEEKDMRGYDRGNRYRAPWFRLSNPIVFLSGCVAATGLIVGLAFLVGG